MEYLFGSFFKNTYFEYSLSIFMSSISHFFNHHMKLMPHMEYSFGVLSLNIYYVFSLQRFNKFNLSYICKNINTEYSFGIFHMIAVKLISDQNLPHLRQTVVIRPKLLQTECIKNSTCQMNEPEKCGPN